MKKSPNDEMIILKKGIKANMALTRDLTVPICATVHEAFKESPSCIFVEKSLELGIKKEDIVNYLQITDGYFDYLLKLAQDMKSHYKYNLKKQLVTNYLKYHG